MLLPGSKIWIVNGVPSTTDFTDPEITIMSVVIYDDLSVVAVICGSSVIWPKLATVLIDRIKTAIIKNEKYFIENLFHCRIFPLL
jgi:hypothetical protein